MGWGAVPGPVVRDWDEPGVQSPALTAQGVSLRSWVLPWEPRR